MKKWAHVFMQHCSQQFLITILLVQFKILDEKPFRHWSLTLKFKRRSNIRYYWTLSNNMNLVFWPWLYYLYVWLTLKVNWLLVWKFPLGKTLKFQIIEYILLMQLVSSSIFISRSHAGIESSSTAVCSLICMSCQIITLGVSNYAVW